jgi:outer membrane protein assembly factor BamC
MIHFVRRVAVAFAAVALVGCSTVDSTNVEYKSASKAPPLEIPPDLTTPARDERHEIPDINPTGTATFPPIVRSAPAHRRPGRPEFSRMWTS